MVKNLPANAGDLGSIPGSGRSSGQRKWQPTPVFVPAKSHGGGRLVHLGEAQGHGSSVLLAVFSVKQAAGLLRTQREWGGGNQQDG